MAYPQKTDLSISKFWLDPKGDLHPVSDSHEEWANALSQELEDLLNAGWVRIQNVPLSYLYLDFYVLLTPAQEDAVGKFFEIRYDQVVAEFRGEVGEFGKLGMLEKGAFGTILAKTV